MFNWRRLILTSFTNLLKSKEAKINFWMLWRIHVIYSPLFIRADPLVVRQSSYCSSVGEVNLKHKSKSLISRYQTEFALCSWIIHCVCGWLRINSLPISIKYEWWIVANISLKYKMTEIDLPSLLLIVFIIQGSLVPIMAADCLCDAWRQGICSHDRDWTGLNE